MRVCFGILFLICVFAHALQLPGICPYKNENLPVGRHIRDCLRITCHQQGTISMLTCPLFYCPEEYQIGYQNMDPSKPFPECCEKPICKLGRS